MCPGPYESTVSMIARDARGHLSIPRVFFFANTCVIYCQGKQFRQTAADDQEPAQTSSSSKNAGSALRAGRMLRILRSLSRTDNVFLTKIDALLPETIRKSSLPELFHQLHSCGADRQLRIQPPLELIRFFSYNSMR